jgi:hypothetical protein
MNFLTIRRSFSVGSITVCIVALNALYAQDQPAGERSSRSELNAFVGYWEVDAARTKVGAVTLAFEEGGDSIRVPSSGGSYTFKIDGADYPTNVPGQTVSWKQVDKRTLEVTLKQNEKSNGSLHVCFQQMERLPRSRQS